MNEIDDFFARLEERRLRHAELSKVEMNAQDLQSVESCLKQVDLELALIQMKLNNDNCDRAFLLEQSYKALCTVSEIYAIASTSNTPHLESTGE